MAGDPNGPELREELAREAFRLAADKLPVTVDFISKATPPRLGYLNIAQPTASSPPDAPKYTIGGVRNLRVLGVEPAVVSPAPVSSA